MPSKRTFDLYLESAADYRITKIGRDGVPKTITEAEARKLWEAGKVGNYNIAFGRLAHFDFSVEAVKKYYRKEK